MTVLGRQTKPLAMLLAGFLLWAGAFLLIYFTQATGCRLGWQEKEMFGVLSLQRGSLVAVYLLACALHLGLIYAFGQSEAQAERAFTHQTGRALAFAALAASLFCFAGIFWLTAC
ncbi:hypothetical protein [Hoeflea sp.]|uniref:hypothetical protein n=1 Tax=Hoeflea sp. TaxID=1940281 RepID=UPI00198D1F80|nr:hypothetical protein [Hoeflea sp.]MBC7282227.1 hypothetical protein [Hoeflea sp.]